MSQQGINLTFILLYFGGLLLVGIAFHWIIIQLFGWLYMFFLWAFIVDTLAFRRAIYGAFSTFVLAPLLLVLLVGFGLNLWLGDYWGYTWPWGAYMVLGAVILTIKYLRYKIRSSPYFLWWFSGRRADIYWANWLTYETLSAPQLELYFQKWRSQGHPEIECQFLSAYLNSLSNDASPNQYTLSLWPLAQSIWLRVGLDLDAYSLSNAVCFYLITRPQTRNFLLDTAQQGRPADAVRIFKAAENYIENFIADPDIYTAEYFLQEGLIDKVEIILNQELPQWEDFAELQAVGSNFFGLHYLAVGIAQNLDDPNNSDDSEHYAPLDDNS